MKALFNDITKDAFQLENGNRIPLRNLRTKFLILPDILLVYKGKFVDQVKSAVSVIKQQFFPLCHFLSAE